MPAPELSDGRVLLRASHEVDGRLAGVALLHALEPDDRRARFAISLYAPDLQGRGIGRAAIACYRACGFVEEGRERESCLLEGQWYDDILMGILEHEFHALDAP
jgi:RimJ/RimL family protein N-acetyltransferase